DALDSDAVVHSKLALVGDDPCRRAVEHLDRVGHALAAAFRGCGQCAANRCAEDTVGYPTIAGRAAGPHEAQGPADECALRCLRVEGDLFRTTDHAKVYGRGLPYP